MNSPIGDEDISPARKAFVVSKAHESISRYFAHWDQSRLSERDLDDAVASVLDAALATRCRWDFTLTMMEFVSRFNNVHTRFIDDLLYRRPALSVELRYVNGDWLVVSDGRHDLTKGDRVLAIDGVAMAGLFKRMSIYTQGSPQARRACFAQLVLHQLLHDEIELTVEDRRGLQHTVHVGRVPPGDARQARLKHRWLRPGRIAYLRLPTFQDPDLTRSAERQIGEYAQAAGLIIDVRGNAGGSTPTDLVARLMDRPHRYWMDHAVLHFGQHTTIAGVDAILAVLGEPSPSWAAQIRPGAADGYRGKIAILADGETMSAAEDFIVPFRISRRAVVVGERTSGSTGQPYFHRFPWNMMLAVGSIRSRFPDGAEFEGVGIEPDLHVSMSREDLYGNRDPVLDAAIAEIEES
ncbi:MAG: S41 family peptidase [Bacteroidota bacterium]